MHRRRDRAHTGGHIMTRTLRAKVMRIPKTTGLWLAFAAARDTAGQIVINADDELVLREEFTHSHPEAMQAAYKLLADLEAELMAEVHDSRASRRPGLVIRAGINSSVPAVLASRRAGICLECGGTPESCKRARVACCPDCKHTPDQLDPHTMEATS